jgi:hypothetical protein
MSKHFQVAHLLIVLLTPTVTNIRTHTNSHTQTHLRSCPSTLFSDCQFHSLSGVDVCWGWGVEGITSFILLYCTFKSKSNFKCHCGASRWVCREHEPPTANPILSVITRSQLPKRCTSHSNNTRTIGKFLAGQPSFTMHNYTHTEVCFVHVLSRLYSAFKTD